MNKECNTCKTPMYYKAFWYAHQGQGDFQMALWQCPRCKDIGITMSDIPAEDITPRVKQNKEVC